MSVARSTAAYNAEVSANASPLAIKDRSIYLFVSFPPGPATANFSKLSNGSSGGILGALLFGAGPSWATGFPFRAMTMRSPFSPVPPSAKGGSLLREC